jgi:hypothetical protein
MIVETDDPRWVDSLRAVQETADTMHDLALGLLDIVPTTVAGVVALLNHVGDGDGDGDWMFPEYMNGEADKRRRKAWRPFNLAVMLHVSKALVSLTGAASQGAKA